MIIEGQKLGTFNILSQFSRLKIKLILVKMFCLPCYQIRGATLAEILLIFFQSEKTLFDKYVLNFYARGGGTGGAIAPPTL